MKTQRLTFVLTVINLFILLIVLLLFTSALKSEIAPIIRGHGFELIDKDGKVRAEIKVMPAEPGLKMPDGTTGYPESVLFRLIDSEGSPNVKIGATEDGAGLVLGGESGYVQILTRASKPIIKLVDQKGNEQIIDMK